MIKPTIAGALPNEQLAPLQLLVFNLQRNTEPAAAVAWIDHSPKILVTDWPGFPQPLATPGYSTFSRVLGKGTSEPMATLEQPLKTNGDAQHTDILLCILPSDGRIPATTKHRKAKWGHHHSAEKEKPTETQK